MHLGIDIGTSATKAVAIDERGTIVASASSEYPLHQPHAGWSEQEPADWWRATCACIAAILKAPGGSRERVEGIGLSGQMHGSVLLDAANQPVRRALLWNDQRTAAECKEIEASVGGRGKLVEMVGNAALTGFTLPKLLWVRKHEPEAWAKVRTVMLPKDYVALRLSGERASDVGDASGTLLFDIEKRAWSSAACKAAGIAEGLLPRVVESTSVIGGLTAEAAKETGLPAGTPIIIGSGDNMAGAVGAGVVEPGVVLATLGTSGVIYAHSDRPRRDLADPARPGRLHTMCAAAGANAWCITGCMLSAGGALKWCRETIAPGVSYDALMAEAASVPKGSEGLVFLPYLTGERCPYPDPLARAGWIGLTSRHTRGHLVRAVIEGVTFGMGQILDLMRSIGAPVNCVRVTGGGNNSLLWRQMQADIYRAQVVSTSSEEGGCALGAALMAAVGTKQWKTVVEACGAAIAVRETLEPADAGGYAASREVYGKLYNDLRERFAELAG